MLEIKPEDLIGCPPILRGPAFKEWPKIERWAKQLWVITEKIDGTNACIIVPEDTTQPIHCQSRARIISTSNDNFGFAKWVEQNNETLRWLGPGYHYGEWWGSGIQRGYGLKEKRFSLFDTFRWDKSEPKKVPPMCCNVVPVLEITSGNIGNSIQFCMDELKKTGSKAAPGFMNPEGIIIYNVGAKMRFKKTFDDKAKGDNNEQAKE